jgi:hypothetical protein
MSMKYFHIVFPEVAIKETRTITYRNHSILPKQNENICV